MLISKHSYVSGSIVWLAIPYTLPSAGAWQEVGSSRKLTCCKSIPSTISLQLPSNVTLVTLSQGHVCALNYSGGRMVLQYSQVDDIQALTFNRLTINDSHANLSS